MKRTLILASTLLAASLFFFSCSRQGGDIAIIRTSSPEFAAYVELFNTSGGRYKAAVAFSPDPAADLLAGGHGADIVAGPWINGNKTRSRLLSLTSLFAERRLDGSAFYRSLLELGNVRGEQLSLPVSFNLPVLAFSRESGLSLQAGSLVPLAEIKSLSMDFNEEEGGAYVRMGFSPGWDAEFLYVAAKLMGADFRDNGRALAWNERNLLDAVLFLREWEGEANSSAQVAEDFRFRYLYVPQERAAREGRILFAFGWTDELLSGPGDKLEGLDFVWPSHNRQAPIRDDAVFLGICRNAENLEAAMAFVEWFFTAEAQQAILDFSRDSSLLESSFGIAGGFSALRAVTELGFPATYPDLLGKMPQESEMKAPFSLPTGWETLKEEAVLPWLSETVAGDASSDIIPLSSLIDFAD